jgi:hypothetical protein
MQNKLINFLKKIIKSNKIFFSILNKVRYLLSKVLRPRAAYLLLNFKKPISNEYGFDRGTPIDRYYIENFLESNKSLITGDCLELLNSNYTDKFGKNVIKSDILDINTDNKKATIYGDLRNLSNVLDSTYDCIILTQVFQFIDDVSSAIKECHRILKPGGVLLVTVPTLGRVDCMSGIQGDYWRFTTASASYLFKKYFSTDKLEINSFGNVSAAINFLAVFLWRR